MFTLTDKQLTELNAWMEKHEEAYTGAIGGRYTYSFTPTGLGTVIVVKDSVTKDSIDITDYEDW